MKLKKVNKSFNQVNFITTFNYDLSSSFYYTSYKQIFYSSVNYSYKRELGYKLIYSLYKNLNIGFFKDHFADFLII